jgi:hypothetical protein
MRQGSGAQFLHHGLGPGDREKEKACIRLYEKQTSVVICVYNYARFLDAVWEACIRKSRPAEEIIVGDVRLDGVVTTENLLQRERVHP